MATQQEINLAVVAMKKATVGIIHNQVTQKVPGMFQGQAEGMVNDIEAALLPVAAKACIDAVDAARKVLK